jgi:hypothetical protein
LKQWRVFWVPDEAARSGARSHVVDDWEGFARREEAAAVRPGPRIPVARVSGGPSADSLRAVTVPSANTRARHAATTQLTFVCSSRSFRTGTIPGGRRRRRTLKITRIGDVSPSAILVVSAEPSGIGNSRRVLETMVPADSAPVRLDLRFESWARTSKSRLTPLAASHRALEQGDQTPR